MNAPNHTAPPTVESNTEPVAHRPGISARAIAQMAVFAALVGALGLMGAIVVPGLVPITAQTLGVMLAAAVLGPWRAAGSIALLLLVVALGMPLLSGGRGGLGAFVAPSSGYLLGWLFGVIVMGLIVHGVRGLAVSGRGIQVWRLIVGGLVGGIGVVYLFGIPVQSALTGLGLWETALTSLAFLPGDLIKLTITVLVTLALWRAYPRAFLGSGR